MKLRIEKWFDTIALIIASIFILFCPFSKRISKIALVLGLLAIVTSALLRFKLRFYKAIFPSNPINKPIFIFFICVVISTFFSLDFSHSVGIFIERYLIYFGFFLFGVYLFKEHRIFLFLTCVLIIFSGFIGVGGLYDYLRWHPYRLYSVFGKHINLTPYLMLCIPLNCMIAFFASHRLLRLTGFINFFTLFLCLVGNGSRAGWVAAAIAMLSCSFLKNRKTALWLAVILSVVFIVLPFQARKRVGGTLQPTEWGRWDLWKAATEISADFPVFGAGTGMFEELLSRYYVPKRDTPGAYTHLHSHNTYLEVISDLGVIGYMAFMSILFFFFNYIWSSYRISQNGNMQAVLIGLASAVLATLILATAATILIVGAQDAAMFWFLLGATTGLARLIRSGAASNVLKSASPAA